MRSGAIWLAVILLPAVPSAALAYGSIGCADLPEHDRAIGALEGMTGACDMTVERAQRVLAMDGDPSVVAPNVPPTPRDRRHRRHRHLRHP